MSGQGKYKPEPWETKSGKGHWTRLYDDLMNSPAYIGLTPVAKTVYFHLKREYKGAYNEVKDTIKLPYSQATKQIGISKSKMNICIYELEQFGFIRTKTNGGLYRVPNQYTFIEEWKKVTANDLSRIKMLVKDFKNAKAKSRTNIYGSSP